MANIESTRDLEYYRNIDKVFWVIANDIKDLFEQYQKIPCIFVEKSENNKMKILKFDYDIEFDEYRYTCWRKVIGTVYKIYIDVLLIKDDKLYNLTGDEILFSSLERSDHLVDKKYLGIMDIKN
jgi:hypothetical protein